MWSQPAGQVHDDKCEVGGDCMEFAYFDGKLDFIPLDSSTGTNEGASFLAELNGLPTDAEPQGVGSAIVPS